ncbi:MAG: hypothetical protein SVU69_08220 [Pseudomonadota bacterium]|nr:hypothetical protein [Pseudomonadota bacterium]
MKRKLVSALFAAALTSASFSSHAALVEMDDAALSDVHGQGVISLAVAFAEVQKHEAILNVARALDLGRELHETREALTRAAVLVPLYVGKEIVVGEILGEVFSTYEKIATRVNLFDAFRLGND